MAVCGPKLSLCCVILSGWGIVQLELCNKNHQFLDFCDWEVMSVTTIEELAMILREQLPALLGIFFYTNSVALVEDIHLNETYQNERELVRDMEKGYEQNAFNCWIAALLYLVTLCVAIQQFWMNNRSTYNV